MQDKYGKTGKFQVISSHAFNYNKKIIDAIFKKKKISFPGYQKLFLKKALPVEGVPHLVLFDQKGNIVEQDFEIDNLDKKIEKLLNISKK